MNTNFYSLWCDPTGNRTRVYRFSSRRSIYSTTVESSRTYLTSRTHFEVLDLETSSPRQLPCPRLEDSTIFEQLKSCWKTPETSRKICEQLFCFPQLEHRRSHEREPRNPSPIEISPMTKMCQNSLLFLQIQFLFSIFRSQQ